MNSPLFDRIDQIGIIVHSIDEHIQYFEKLFGKDAFVILEGESTRIYEDGSEAKIKAKAAFAKLGNIQLELLEIKEGPTVHLEWLEKRGEGIHHLGMFVSDFDESLKTFKEAGIPLLQLGRGRMRYAYFDTKPFCLEIIEKLPEIL